MTTAKRTMIIENEGMIFSIKKTAMKQWLRDRIGGADNWDLQAAPYNARHLGSVDYKLTDLVDTGEAEHLLGEMA